MGIEVEFSGTTTSPISSSPVILIPCAACKILRRRCTLECVLAPYFPPTEPAKFTMAHRVFGAGNIIKLLHELPEAQRADAVSSMVYEASARLRDPVYGCTGFIFLLQQQISELQSELAKAQAQMIKIRCKNAELSEFIDKCIVPTLDESPNSSDDIIAALLNSPSSECIYNW